MNEIELEGRTFPAGTIVHMNGIPVALVLDTNLETHPNNWKAIEQAAQSVGLFRPIGVNAVTEPSA
jgi:hypothetical protein